MWFAVLLAASVGILVDAVPSVPPPVAPHALALQQTIDAAIAVLQPTLTIAPGRYVFSNTALTIAGASNLVIEATDVTFVFFYGFGMAISSCHNLTVRGLTIDADPPNYAQGTVTAVTNATSFAAQFDEAFLPPDTTTQPFSHPGGLAGAKF